MQNQEFTDSKNRINSRSIFFSIFFKNKEVSWLVMIEYSIEKFCFEKFQPEFFLETSRQKKIHGDWQNLDISQLWTFWRI